jgi:hypothetical protein
MGSYTPTVFNKSAIIGTIIDTCLLYAFTLALKSRPLNSYRAIDMSRLVTDSPPISTDTLILRRVLPQVPPERYSPDKF